MRALSSSFPSACLLLALLALCRAAIQPADAEATPNDWRSDAWTLHDPNFPVSVSVAPFADRTWNATAAARASQATGVLHVPSSVLNITIQLPPVANLTSAEVSLTLFRQQDGAKDAGRQYAAIADTHVAYAKSYRIDVGTQAEQMVLRVFVEAHTGVDGSERKSRAFYVRALDLSPSAPVLLECPSDQDVESPDVRIASFPPVHMPMDLCAQYTMGGRVPVRQWYFDDQSDMEDTYAERSFEFIEDLIADAKARRLKYYGETDAHLFAALDAFPIADQRVLIVGSTIPWYESICIARGAASCTTVDYNLLRYHHPKIRTMTVTEMVTQADAMQFDAIFSISSYEHDGLGRYGDTLDPDADLKAMQRLRQDAIAMMRGDANARVRLFLAVPIGADTLVWNAQRVYGPLRLPLLLKGWKVVDSFGFDKSDFEALFSLTHQPVFVLEPELEQPQQAPHTEL